MWIRSQSKDVLVNINEVCFYKMKKDSKFIYQFRCCGYGNYYILGYYSTEEKALKVLDFIQRKLILHFTETYEIVRPVLNSEQWEPYWKKNEYVFQMPADEEV